VQLSKLKLIFRHLGDLFNNGSEQDIYSEKDFLKIIERERERANRNNHPFSLIVFDLESFQVYNLYTSKFIKMIILRMRKIDEIGWYSQRRIGILLPYTNSQGAAEFIESLQNFLGIKMRKFSCTVYSYPSDKFRNNNVEKDLRRIA
jgi:hypothetical protein